MKVQAPCKGCEDRNPECHGKCERYKAFQAENEKAKAKAREERDLDWQQDRREFGQHIRIGLSNQKARYNT